jgi:hypothetical protein
MKFAVALARFWYDFVIGEDWQIAFAVVIAMGLVGLLAYDDVNAWWLLPLAVFLMLNVSLWRASRAAGSRRSASQAPELIHSSASRLEYERDSESHR